MRTAITIILTLLLAGACFTGCRERTFQREYAIWQQERIERLRSESGWLNLAGLYWLREGENSFGSDSSNYIEFPQKAPAFIGTYILDDGYIRFIPQEDAGVLCGDSLAREMEIAADQDGQPTLLQTGSLAWYIIERGGKYGIRLRDYEHPALKAFKGIESFPAKPEWMITAEFEAFAEPREFLVPTVLGTFESYRCPGILRFSIGGTGQVIYPMESGERFFIIFADGTSGLETYGGGRFLYTDIPDKDGRVLIDFNRAYNPPCAFTAFATCPLPPRENLLDVRIEAGEKYSSGGH